MLTFCKIFLHLFLHTGVILRECSLVAHIKQRIFGSVKLLHITDYLFVLMFLPYSCPKKSKNFRPRFEKSDIIAMVSTNSRIIFAEN